MGAAQDSVFWCGSTPSQCCRRSEAGATSGDIVRAAPTSYPQQRPYNKSPETLPPDMLVSVSPEKHSEAFRRVPPSSDRAIDLQLGTNVEDYKEIRHNIKTEDPASMPAQTPRQARQGERTEEHSPNSENDDTSLVVGPPLESLTKDKKGEFKKGKAASMDTTPKSATSISDPVPISPAKTDPLVPVLDPANIMVTIEKKGGVRLGLKIDLTDKQSLLIEGVEDGLLKDWNEAHPDMEVRAKDRIVRVNGISGNAIKLCDVLKTDNSLVMEVSRAR